MSGFEASLANKLNELGVPFTYEAKTFPITVDVSGYCTECGSSHVARKSRYTPDFFFPVWIIEAKGKFTPKDRKRVLALLRDHPGIKFGLLFQRDNWLTSRKVSRYTDWAREHNIPSAVGWFKQEWLT